MDVRCSTCRYADMVLTDVDGAGPSPEYLCRRYPPAVLALPDRTDEAARAWVTVEPDDWCGEHQPATPPGPLPGTWHDHHDPPPRSCQYCDEMITQDTNGAWFGGPAGYPCAAWDKPGDEGPLRGHEPWPRPGG